MSKTSTEIINETEINKELVENSSIPLLCDWKPEPDQIYMEFKGDYVQASYDRVFGKTKDNKIGIYIVKKNHYKDRMTDICNVINYFLSYFDTDLKLFESCFQIKFIIDQRPDLTKNAFRKLIIDYIVTEDFIRKIKDMANYLYRINIDTDSEGKYKSTPKITNDQARQIVALSFAIRCILPICVHFSDTNNKFLSKKDYINCFDKIFMKILKMFEKDDVTFFNAICKFVKYRVDRFWSADIGICLKKKQLYGTTKEIYLEEVLHEVILVKSLYKLDYNRSVVSFIDGVVFLYHKNFKIENFKSKPIEIDPTETSDDSNDNISHKEAIEISVYRIDESNSLISEVNTSKVLKKIRKSFHLDISPEELAFYNENLKISPITKLFLESFYDRYFHDVNATINISREITVELVIYMKKYLQLKGMGLIAQLVTANVRGRYKENAIKNAKFLEKIRTSDVWNSVIQKKYTYINQLSQKDDPLIKRFSSFINSTFEFLDFDSNVNGYLYEDVDQDRIIAEFSLFLSII